MTEEIPQIVKDLADAMNAAERAYSPDWMAADIVQELDVVYIAGWAIERHQFSADGSRYIWSIETDYFARKRSK